MTVMAMMVSERKWEKEKKEKKEKKKPKKKKWDTVSHSLSRSLTGRRQNRRPPSAS